MKLVKLLEQIVFFIDHLVDIGKRVIIVLNILVDTVCDETDDN